MQMSLVLLEENLMRVFRGLRSLKEKEGIGFIGQAADEPEEDIYYPNRIIRLLHKVAAFLC